MKRLTKQERTRRRVALAERKLRQQTLWVPVASHKEREYIRSRVWYSGAGDNYVATFVGALPLAIDALMRLHRTRRVIVRKAADGFHVYSQTTAQERRDD